MSIELVHDYAPKIIFVLLGPLFLLLLFFAQVLFLEFKKLGVAPVDLLLDFHVYPFTKLIKLQILYMLSSLVQLIRAKIR